MDIRSTKAFKFWEKYEHHLGLGALAAGFFFDLIIADRPDSVGNNLLLLAYLLIAGTFIIILNQVRTRRLEAQHHVEPFFLLLILQFCFGGLASNLLVLYGRSGTLGGSVVFLAMLVGLIVGNEYLRNRYAVLKFNVAVYYFLLLSYCVIAVPTFITHSVGGWSFLLSGITSLVVIAVFLAVLFFSVFRGRDINSLRAVGGIVALIFICFNVLYYINVIPPVPLSLKSIGVYHSVLKRQDGGYVVLYERPHWWEFWRNSSGTYHAPAGPTGRGAFCYSSVFAPTDLSAPVYHKWEHYDGGEWRVQSRISFPIAGGRDGGYRGYSAISTLEAGKWRCSVETSGGALIGRIGFTVQEASTTPPLSQKTL